MVFPYLHRLSGSNEAKRATLLFECRLRHYESGLRYAGSRYAYPTLGSLIGVRAGAYAAAQIVETRGMYLGTAPSAEDVADNWEQISKLDDQAEALFQGGEQTRRFFELIQAANNE